MGTQYSTMKVLILTSAMLALAASDSCSDCTAVVSHIAGRLSTPESLAAQGEILVGELCPGAPDPEACVSGLPGLWNQIAAILWPGYWDPTADWMCADICAAPEDTTMTCDDCKMGIQAAIDQLLSEAAMDAIVEAIAPIICQDNPTEECPAAVHYAHSAVDVIIRQGLPALVAAGSDGDFGQACNGAVEGTCPARKLRLF